MCERERERFWVKEWHGPRREVVCVCVRERERDSGLRNGMALGGKLCVCERERVWVKD